MSVQTNASQGFVLAGRYKVASTKSGSADIFGSCTYDGVDLQSGVEVGVKVISKFGDNSSRAVQSEVDALTRLRKRRVAAGEQMVDFLQSRSKYYVVTRNGKKAAGTLLSSVSRHGPFSEHSARFTVREILKAVNDLHESGVCHRALTLQNIGVDQYTGEAVIFDFSSASTASKKTLFNEQPALTSFTAPEVLARHTYWGEPADVWSLGMVFYAMLTGGMAFSGETRPEALLHLMRTTEVVYSPSLSASAADFLHSMLRVDPDERLSIAQLLRHPWLADDDSLSLTPRSE
eukprot:gene13059-20145_t